MKVIRRVKIVCPSCKGTGHIVNPEIGATSCHIPCIACTGKRYQHIVEILAETDEEVKLEMYVDKEA
jgi:excinuclease UvrABC ATPase subunit